MVFSKKEKLFHLFLYFLFLFSFVKSLDEPTQLIIGKSYNQTSLENEEYYYKINPSGIPNIKKIFIDVMTYIGDVEVITHFTNEAGLDVGHYSSINKIFLSIKIKENAELPDELVFSIKAKSNAFYMVLNNFASEDIDDSLITNELQTGLSYLVTIDTSIRESYDIGNKVIKFYNPNIENRKPIAVSFFSLNCKIDVGQIYTDKESTLVYAEAKKFDHFSHDFIDPRIDGENERYVENLEYRINVVDEDKSEFDRNLCKLYVSANEVSQNHEETTKDIIIPDNIAQQVMFGKDFNHASYGYVHVNLDKDLLIKFNPKHRAQYNIKIYYEYEKRESDQIIVANEILYLKSNEWKEKCKDNKKGCYIQLDITLEKTKEIENPILEFSIEQIGSNSVSYLPENIMKIDYVHNFNSQYYYTELGESEEGFVIINFLRGSGNIYARIVEEGQSESGGNWRGKYILPNENNSLQMDTFTKKVTFSTFGKDCQKGCYLLINVMSDTKSDIMDTNFPFSLIVHTHEFNIMSYKNIPLISVPTDQFIVGTVSEFTTNENIYQFYSVWINSDAEQVLIDFQSKTGGLFINIGYEKPTTLKNDFNVLSNGKDQVFTIKKNEILEKAKAKKEYKDFENIKDIVLTIGVWTYIANTRDTTPFAFIVRLDKGINDIYRVNSDQKALCKTKKIIDKNFRCLYAIEYDLVSEFSVLFIHPNAQSKTPFINVYGKAINQIDYEIDPENKLKDLIPNKNNFNYSNHESSGDYLFIKQGFYQDNYFLVSVETDSETTIELLTSFYIFQSNATANPRTPQLFIISGKDTPFNLKFSESYTEMVNIGCIGGSAEIFWESNPSNKYYIAGKDDKISITSEKSGKSHVLNIVPKTTFDDGLGFIFYVDSDIRANDFNFDELILDSSSYYMYSENDLPISFYAPIDESIMQNSEYYDIFFSFDTLENEEKVISYYGSIPFSVNAYIIKQNTVWSTKRNPNTAVQTGNPILGSYDPSLKTGFIRITKEDIKKSQISEEDKPNLYLTIKKSDNKGNKEGLKYNKVGLEISAVKNIPEIPISELSYQFGKLEKNQKEKKYRLKIDNSFKYLNLKFSCINNNALSIKIEGRNDLKEEKEEYGRKIYSLATKKNEFSVILIISRNSQKISTEEFFTFQYIHSNDKYLDNYKILSTSLGIEKKIIENQKSNEIQKINVDISIDPVKDYKNYDISYIIKGFEESSTHKQEKSDLTLNFDKSQYIVEYKNPKVDEKTNKLNFNLKDIPDRVDFIQVIAQIKDKEKLEYLSYDLFEISPKKDGNSNKFILLFILVGVFLFAIIIVLIVIVIIYNNKNKDLLDQVNKISFIISRDTNKDNEDKDALDRNNEENLV